MADISLRLQVRDDGTVVVQNFTKALKQGLEEVEKAAKSVDSKLGDTDEKLGGLVETANKSKSILTGFRSNIIFLNQAFDLLGRTLGTVVNLFEIGAQTAETMLRTLIRLGSGVVQVTENYIKFSSVLESALGRQRGAQIAAITREIANVSPLLEQQVRGIVQGVALVPSLTLGLKTSELDETRNTLEKIVDAVQALTVFRSDLPPESALFSFREFLQGQLRSLQFRFDIDPLSILSAQGISAAEFKSAAPIERVEQFIKLSEFLVSKETVRKLSEVPSVLFGNIIEFFQNFGITVGQSGFYDHVNDILKRTFAIINDAFTTGPFVKLAQPVSDALSTLLDIGLESASDIVNNILDRFLSVNERDVSLIEKVGKILFNLFTQLNREGIPSIKRFIEQGIQKLDMALDTLSSEKFISGLREVIDLMSKFVGLATKLIRTGLPSLESLSRFAGQNPATTAGIGAAALVAPSAIGAGVGAGISSISATVTTLVTGTSVVATIIGVAAAALAGGVGGYALGTFIDTILQERDARRQQRLVAQREEVLVSFRQNPEQLLSVINQLGVLAKKADIADEFGERLRVTNVSEVTRAFSPLERQFNDLRNQLLETGLFDAFNDLDFAGARGQPGKMADIIRGVQVGLQRQLDLIDQQIDQQIVEQEKVNVLSRFMSSGFLKLGNLLERTVPSLEVRFRNLDENLRLAGQLVNQFTQEGGLQSTIRLEAFGLTELGGAADTRRTALKGIFGIGGETAVEKVAKQVRYPLLFGGGQAPENQAFGPQRAVPPGEGFKLGLPTVLQQRVIQAVSAAQTGLQRALSQEFVTSLIDSFSGKGPSEIGALIGREQGLTGEFDTDLRQALSTIVQNERISQDKSATFLELRQAELSSAKARRNIIRRTVETLTEQVQTLKDLGKEGEQVTKEEQALLELRKVQLAAEEDRVARIQEEISTSQGLRALRSGIEAGVRDISFESPFEDLGKEATRTLRDSLSSGIVDGIKNGGRQGAEIFKTFLGTIEDAVLQSAAKTLANFAVTQLIGLLGNVAGSLFGGGAGGVGEPGPQAATPQYELIYGANGTIFPGSFHPVRRFAAGDPFVDRPTLGMIGEGATPEAVIPLSNGRSIPVQLQGMPTQSSPTVVELTNVNTVDPNMIKQVVAENKGEVIFNVLGSNSKKLKQIIARG